MTTVAIISEYNPFHNGHSYQIQKIREQFGTNTRIIAIMGGNFTQRGDVAIIDKGLRARCAVEGGVNLVLELPFPYSLSSAEFFATAGVKIANALGAVDYLSFGSECGDVDILTAIAKCMLSREYKTKIQELLSRKDLDNIGFPSLCELALKDLLNSRYASLILSPNNILAVEYIKALIQTNSSIKPHTIKRIGASFSSDEIVSGEYQSATALRSLLLKSDLSATKYISETTKNVILAAIEDGDAPCSSYKLDAAVISYFRLSTQLNPETVEVKGGLYNRLKAMSFKTNNINTLVKLSCTKKYTLARVQRAIWYSLLGVTSSDLKDAPAYTQVLAMDKEGQALLKTFGKDCEISIVTKPSNTKGLSDAAKRQKAKSDMADSIFQLTKPGFHNGNSALTFTPFVKKGV